MAVVMMSSWGSWCGEPCGCVLCRRQSLRFPPSASILFMLARAHFWGMTRLAQCPSGSAICGPHRRRPSLCVYACVQPVRAPYLLLACPYPVSAQLADIFVSVPAFAQPRLFICLAVGTVDALALVGFLIVPLHVCVWRARLRRRHRRRFFGAFIIKSSRAPPFNKGARTIKGARNMGTRNVEGAATARWLRVRALLPPPSPLSGRPCVCCVCAERDARLQRVGCMFSSCWLRVRERSGWDLGRVRRRTERRGCCGRCAHVMHESSLVV